MKNAEDIISHSDTIITNKHKILIERFTEKRKDRNKANMKTKQIPRGKKAKRRLKHSERGKISKEV